jgi:hypothetical protein
MGPLRKDFHFPLTQFEKLASKKSNFWAPVTLILFCISLFVLYVYLLYIPQSILVFTSQNTLEEGEGLVEGIVLDITQTQKGQILTIQSYCTLTLVGPNSSNSNFESGDFIQAYGTSRKDVFFYEWVTPLD